jgi:hypothetical protein
VLVFGDGKFPAALKQVEGVLLRITEGSEQGEGGAGEPFTAGGPLDGAEIRKTTREAVGHCAILTCASLRFAGGSLGARRGCNKYARVLMKKCAVTRSSRR